MSLQALLTAESKKPGASVAQQAKAQSELDKINEQLKQLEAKKVEAEIKMGSHRFVEVAFNSAEGTHVAQVLGPALAAFNASLQPPEDWGIQGIWPNGL